MENTARRPQREHLSEKRENSNLGIRNILNIIFMLLAIVGVLLYVYSSISIVDVSLGGIIIGVAILVKAVEVVLRMVK